MRRAAMVMVGATLLFGSAAMAGDDNPECLGSSCGKPMEEGGGCGCGCGCSVWVAYTDDGTTLAYTDDADGDGKADDRDNCAFAPNRDQLDSDGDGVGNQCDNCSGLSNFSQLDSDGDGQGDLCDGDIDGDSAVNAADNCPGIPNRLQGNADNDSQGDVCDDDDDNDGVLDRDDKCPTIADPSNAPNTDARCRVDSDTDNILDAADNCPALANPQQSDLDGDGMGDVCDLDTDNDGLNDKRLVGTALENLAADNCPGVRNRNQIDDDGDGLGDACDALYCVVVDPANKSDCLNPASAFKVSGGGSILLKKGEKFRLPLFANRNGAGIEYEWTVEGRPAGSRAGVVNPTGVASLSRHWEYAYADGQVPSFTADADGEYTLQLNARLAVPDRAYPANRTSSSSLRLSAAAPDGKPGSATCAAVPVDASMMGLGLLALAGLARRRKM